MTLREIFQAMGIELSIEPEGLPSGGCWIGSVNGQYGVQISGVAPTAKQHEIALYNLTRLLTYDTLRSHAVCCLEALLVNQLELPDVDREFGNVWGDLDATNQDWADAYDSLVRLNLAHKTEDGEYVLVWGSGLHPSWS